MNNNQIQSFISVVEAQSFNQAEKRLFISRQALKKQIDSLENELGFDLFIRTHQGIELTPVGAEFYHGIKDINDQLDTLIYRCRDLTKHEYTIRIGSPAQPRMILEKSFSEFSKLYPYIKQEIVSVEENQMAGMVLNGSVDIAECILTPDINGSELTFYKLADLEYRCLLDPNHPLAGKDILEIKDLAPYTTGINPSKNSQLIQAIKSGCPDITLIETRGSSQEHQQIFTICYNQGIFIYRSYKSTFMEPLVSIPLKTDIKSECVMLYRKNPTKIVRNFTNVVRECIPVNN